MPGLTPNQSFPYPLYTDPAGSGPAQIQALADAVDDAIVAQQTAIANAVNRKRALISSTVVQAVPNGVDTNGTFATVDFDNDTMANLGVDNTALTVKTAGLYLIEGEANFVLNATGSRQIRLMVAGVSVGAMRSLTSPATSGTQIGAWTLAYCTVGTVLRLSLFQNSGGALNSDVRKLSAVRITG